MADASAPEVYLSLYQAIVWARTRELTLVDEAAGQSKRVSAAFDVKVAIRQSKLKAAGRDINRELWSASGWQIPSTHMTIGGFEFVEMVEPAAVETYEARLSPFPLEEYLQRLLRTGRIRSLRKRPGEAEYHALSSADWNDLEISEKDGLRVAMSILPTTYGDYLFVQVSQADVLREFPAEPPGAAAAPEAEVAAAAQRSTDEEVEAWLRLLEQEKRNIPAQDACWEIARKRYPQLTRDDVVARHKAVWPTAKPGPRGPRKNRPK
jgi:hypothetical protein